MRICRSQACGAQLHLSGSTAAAQTSMSLSVEDKGLKYIDRLFHAIAAGNHEI